MTSENNGLKRSLEDEDDSENSSSMEDESENESDVEDEEMELGENDREIQVDFEGQIPCLEDFAGIKSLLHQLFLKAHVNLSSLTDLILAQSFVGSVLKVQLNLIFMFDCRVDFSLLLSNVSMKVMKTGVMTKVLLMRCLASQQF